MKLANLGFLLSSVLVLSACEDTLKFENGRIPKPLLPYAQALMGEYHGTKEGFSDAIQLSLDGDRLVVTSDEDPVMAGCNSVVGNLKSVRYSGAAEKGDMKISSAIFEFSAPNCPLIQGNKFEIYNIARNDGRISFRTRILSKQYFDRECRWQAGSPPSYDPREVCETNLRRLYIEGRYSN
jgi:hypothetical protein